MSEERPGNRLASETSPYLLQHAHNPVDWYPWGEEALELARREDRPIFLSIGYSACHWCHVMEHESFEDPTIAAVMNELFVNIKVDREERPDLDEIYMTSCQVLTGQGGWPLSVWLTPDLQPFFAGTYFPPASRWGRPGFPDILRRLHDLYTRDRDGLEKQAAKLTELVQLNSGLQEGGAGPGPELVEAYQDRWRGRFDSSHGGLRGAPKFPPGFALESILRRRETHPTERARTEEILTLTLDGMARGGMYDQLGGGFHRYSTDERWLVPHFEKMLYDNAQLVPLYLRAGEVLERDDWLRVARETLDWCRREMLSPEGGIYSTQDADSEGVEGKFFVWDVEEIEEVVVDDEDCRLTKAWFDVSARGNWHEMPGKCVLNTPMAPAEAARVLGVDEEELRERVDRARAQLLERRGTRVAPGTDTKVLTAWNGLMIGAFSRGATVLESPEYLETARRAAEFCLGTLRVEGGLLRTARDGVAHLNAYQEDYAYLAQGLLDLFEASAELRWLEEAEALCREMRERFWDEEGKGFFFTSHDHEQLIARTKNPVDNATPSGNSVAVKVLLRLAQLTGNEEYRSLAEETLTAFAPGLDSHPLAYGNMANALDMSLRPPAELILVGPPESDEIRDMRRAGRVALGLDALILEVDPSREDLDALRSRVPLLAGKEAREGAPMAYLCSQGACRAPAASPEELREQLDAFASPGGGA